LRDHNAELQFWTVVGRGNGQTVLWKVALRHESIVVDESTLDDFSQQSYKATFANGIPDFFVPRTDYQVLREFRRRQVEIARLRS
jgi:hypothetical protein